MEISEWCLEICRGGITIYIMSKMIVFLIKDEIGYEKSVLLSKRLISYCLDKNFGVMFNFLGYSHDLINKFTPSLYFSISDDFLQLNSEFLSTSNILYINEIEGKKEFCEKFSVLDDIYNILLNYKILNIKLLISSESKKINDFITVNCNSQKVTEIIYDSIISNAENYAYDFPDLIINFN